MTTPALSEIERRALGNLPRWRSDEEWAEVTAHMREASNYPEDWRPPRSLSTLEVAVRLVRDEYFDTTALTEADVESVLSGLSARGLCDRAGEQWAMSSDGLDALQA